MYLRYSISLLKSHLVEVDVVDVVVVVVDDVVVLVEVEVVLVEVEGQVLISENNASFSNY